MLVVQREIKRCERKLAPIENASGGQFSVIHFFDEFGRNFLRRIAVISCKGVEYLLVPDPVLEHLRRRLDEIAGDMCSGEPSILGARRDGMQCVAKLVE